MENFTFILLHIKRLTSLDVFFFPKYQVILKIRESLKKKAFSLTLNNLY